MSSTYTATDFLALVGQDIGVYTPYRFEPSSHVIVHDHVRPRNAKTLSKLSAAQI